MAITLLIQCDSDGRHWSAQLLKRQAGFWSMRAARLNGEILDGFSIDLEDYFHVEAFADGIHPRQWSQFPARVRRNTERVLALLESHGCRATFFVLGWIAEREPALIREIAAAGHEIACHSHLHRKVNTLTPAQFREDVRRARAAIEAAANRKVEGFRAPTFSIGSESLWALQVLEEEGFRYDSSIFPIRHDLYGSPDAPRFPHWRQLPSGKRICEIPISTVRLLGQNFPAVGGGYLRLFPMRYIRWAIRRIHRHDQQPVIIYAHPWEIDPDQPRLNGPRKSVFRHYTGLKKTEARLEEILSNGHFRPLIDLVRHFESLEPLEKPDTAGIGLEALEPSPSL